MNFARCGELLKSIEAGRGPRDGKRKDGAVLLFCCGLGSLSALDMNLSARAYVL
jgi:hypothetical protein